MDKLEPKKNKKSGDIFLGVGLVAGILFIIMFVLIKLKVFWGLSASGDFGLGFLIVFFTYICLLPIAVISTFIGLLIKLFNKYD